MDNLLSIGHLNNAQSALKRTGLNPAYAPLVREIHERIGKIKFYIVMSDFPNVQMRLSQLLGVLQALIGAQTNGGVIVVPQTGGQFGGYNGGYRPSGPNEIPQGSTGRPNNVPGHLQPTNN